MEFEFIAERLDEKEIKTNAYKSKYANIIEDWLKTENKTLKFICKNEREKKNCSWAITSYKKAHNYDYVIYREAATLNIYLVKP